MNKATAIVAAKDAIFSTQLIFLIILEYILFAYLFLLNWVNVYMQIEEQMHCIFTEFIYVFIDVLFDC